MFLDLLKALLIICFSLMMFCKILKKDKLNLVFKMLTSISLFTLAVYYSARSYEPKAALVTIGMFFGVIGDLLLGLKVSDFVKEKYKGKLLLTGFIAFAIGHIFYLSYFYMMCLLRPMDLLIPFLGSFLIVIVILLFKRFKIMDYGKFVVPCMVYGYLLLFVVLTTFTHSIRYDVNWIAFIGFLLFIISDLILMVLYFSPKDKVLKYDDEMLLTFFNLITYFAAQYIIIHIIEGVVKYDPPII